MTWHSKQCSKQNFGVARKIILCWNKKFDVAQKSNFVSTKTCWCCTKKYFMSTKKVDVAQESILCRQKQDDAASKNYFGRKKVITLSKQVFGKCSFQRYKTSLIKWNLIRTPKTFYRNVQPCIFMFVDRFSVEMLSVKSLKLWLKFDSVM